MTKGMQLFKDFLKAGNRMALANTDAEWWQAMLDVSNARDKLEAYLDPPRDRKGHFRAALKAEKEKS